jgi:hypothetical protein
MKRVKNLFLKLWLKKEELSENEIDENLLKSTFRPDYISLKSLNEVFIWKNDWKFTLNFSSFHVVVFHSVCVTDVSSLADRVDITVILACLVTFFKS